MVRVELAPEPDSVVVVVSCSTMTTTSRTVQVSPILGPPILITHDTSGEQVPLESLDSKGLAAAFAAGRFKNVCCIVGAGMSTASGKTARFSLCFPSLGLGCRYP